MTADSASHVSVSSEADAARTIQRFWRRHVDVSLFKRLKTLVDFRNQGDPATLLKVINPIEAQLLDPAVGARVRFRLGGFDWPPQIYYKIFLHSPICDVNSYAPRNYADRSSGAIPPVPASELAEATEKYGWYRRIENNGWRPISSLSPTAVDAITQLTNKVSPKKGPKCKKKRNVRQEVAKLKLQRYLQKQKEQGPLKEGEPELTEDDLANDDILAWAEELDLEQYKSDWQAVGTTGPSSTIWWKLDEEEPKEEAEDESSGSELDEAELLRLIA
jgi:hypothetical protein